jgi:peptide methionine sulfoxide reductase msrA/msrB
MKPNFLYPALFLFFAALAFSADSSNLKDSDMQTVTVRLLNEDGTLSEPTKVPKVVLPDRAWQHYLTPEQYAVARGKGTEPPFCGAFYDNKKDGIYVCACCGLPLFASDAKFDSGTGWPSFLKSVAKENIVEQSDTSHGMVRTEVLCARCGAHLGHVFPDGPKPTGLRYCLNSVSLVFRDKNSFVTKGMAQAMFGAGCFWEVQDLYSKTPGVVFAEAGYSGGHTENPTYAEVCSDATGHAEVVHIVYDPKKISYEKLLDLFWENHDPTQMNRQGPDVGSQYRSAIFYYTQQQKTEAEASKTALQASKKFNKPIVTQILLASAFYPAEEFHQNYLTKKGLKSCHIQ